MLWCVKQISPTGQDICSLISWGVVCGQLLPKSLPGNCPWQKGAAWLKVAYLSRDSLHPEIGQFWGLQRSGWLASISGCVCRAILASELCVGSAEALLQPYHPSTSSPPQTGFPHYPSGIFPDRTPYTNFFLRICFLGNQAASSTS